MRSILIISVLLMLVGCGRQPGKAPASGTTKVRIQLNWVPEPEFGGIYEAQRAGIFAREGLDVEILKGGPDVPAVQMVASGQVEFGIAAADEVLSLREKGGDLVGLFATYQTAPQGIMAHVSGTVTGIEGIWKSNGTLAVQPGLAYVKYFRKKWGEPAAQLVPYQGGIGQFMADPNLAQQCFVTAEPIAAQRAGAKTKVFLIADTGFNPYTAVVVTNGKYLRDHADAVGAFIRSLRRGWRLYQDDPAPANAIMCQYNTSMDEETFARAAEVQRPLIEPDQTKKTELGAMTEARWEELGKQLVEIGVIEKAPPASKCFNLP